MLSPSNSVSISKITQGASVSGTSTTGSSTIGSSIVIVTLSVTEQLSSLVTVTSYVVVSVGKTNMKLSLSPVDHK